MSRPQRIPELRPDIVFLFQLVKQLVDGELRIPRFQRAFVWRPQQMLDLLDSINLQYPIGSLLAWESDSEVVTLESVGPVQLQRTEGGQALYLLDGHQRISTIAGALVSVTDRTSTHQSDDAWKWNIYYNARERAFEHLPVGAAPQPYQFPMSKLLDTFEFIDESKRVLAEGGAEGRDYLELIQDVARTFQTYKIPVISIRQTGLTEAVEIFARLNSKGQAMTADQMVSALLYREDSPNPFDLAQEISKITEHLQARGFGEIDRTLILRALLAAIGEGIYRTDWTRITLNKREDLLSRMKKVLPDVRVSIDRALDFLAIRGVRTERLLPYGMQLIVLSSFFLAQPSPSKAQEDLMERWFWVSSFSTWFGGANPSRVNALVRDVMDSVAKNPLDPTFSTFELATPAAPLPRSFDMRGARTRALLLVMFSLGPRTQDGAVIADPNALVERYGPNALGYVAAISNADLSGSPANRILRPDATDGRQAKFWLGINDEETRAKVWASHAIPESAAGALAADMSRFLRLRLEEMRRIELEFMREHGVNLPVGGIEMRAEEDLDPFRLF